MKWEKSFLTTNGYITRKTSAVYDPEFTKALGDVPWKEWFVRPSPLACREEYLATYVQWIASSTLNQVSGVETFPIHHLINGTTQAFDEFYYKHKGRRLRFFKGEYAYHQRAYDNWSFLDEAPLSENDAIIVSAPFCSTGSVHPEMFMVLDQAEDLQIPIMVDCAYFGTCLDLQLDLSHPAIDEIVFSLTKGVGLGDIRSGIRFSKIKDSLPISQQNDYNHTVLSAAKIGLYMMEKFSPDFIPTKYREMQQSLCREAGVEPTNCMHLAMGDERWDDFRIDGIYNRLGIRELIKARRKGEI